MVVDKQEEIFPSLFSSGSPVVKTFDLIPCPIAFWSADRRFCILNHQARELLRFSELDFRQDASLWLNRIEPRDRDLFSAACKKLLRGEKMVTCDYRFFPGGSDKQIWLRDISVSQQNGPGKIEAVFSAYTNISDLKTRRLRNHRDGQEGDPTEVIDGLIHEIQNNLQVISSGLDLWRMSGGTPSEYRPLVLVVERVNRWIRELREFFIPPKAHFSKADPARVVADVVRHMETELQRQGIRLKLRCQDSLPLVKLDVNQFRSALERLVEFSCALLRRGGELEVETGSDTVGDEQYVRLKVGSSSADSLGVEEKEVYTPFLRINNRQFGLSIPLAYRILHRHHGKIFFKRENSQKSHFTILLRTCSD